MTSAVPRPRTVEVAFWSWLVAGVMLVLGGLLAVTTGFGAVRERLPDSVTDEQIHSLLTLYRGTAVICIVAGAAVGYLASRTRQGDNRFRRANVALSFAIVAFVAVCALLLGLLLPLMPLAAIALIVAAVAATRDTASSWFDAVESRSAGA